MRFITIVFGFLIAILIAEISVRIFFPHSRDHVIPGSLFRMDPDLGWSFQKGESSRHQTQTFDVGYQINTLGYRDRERVLKKKTGTKRVLLYGDSQVFGWGLPMEDRYSDLLENRIANIEIWNLAVPAYGLDQELLSFERDAKRFSPDIAIFLASHSTLGRTRYGYNYKKHKPQFLIGDDGGLNLIPIPETGRLINEFLYKSMGWLYLPYFVEIRLEVLKSQFQTEVRQRPRVDRLREINKRILLRAMSTVKDSGVRFVVLGTLNNPKRQELEAFCKEHEISFMHYGLSGPMEKWELAPTDGHYNRQATMAIADQIEPQLRMLLTSKGAISEDKSP